MRHPSYYNKRQLKQLVKRSDNRSIELYYYEAVVWEKEDWKQKKAHTTWLVLEHCSQFDDTTSIYHQIKNCRWCICFLSSSSSSLLFDYIIYLTIHRYYHFSNISESLWHNMDISSCIYKFSLLVKVYRKGSREFTIWKWMSLLIRKYLSQGVRVWIFVNAQSGRKKKDENLLHWKTLYG